MRIKSSLTGKEIEESKARFEILSNLSTATLVEIYKIMKGGIDKEEIESDDVLFIFSLLANRYYCHTDYNSLYYVIYIDEYEIREKDNNDVKLIRKLLKDRCQNDIYPLI